MLGRPDFSRAQRTVGGREVEREPWTLEAARVELRAS